MEEEALSHTWNAALEAGKEKARKQILPVEGIWPC